MAIDSPRPGPGGPAGPFRPGLGEDRLRGELRDWLADRVPVGWQAGMQEATAAEQLAFQRSWFAQLRQAGLLTPHWPAEWGGGYSVAEQVVIHEEVVASRAPRLGAFIVSLFQMPAAVLAGGDREQAARHLRSVLDGGTVWCQGFSEPEAGSDLASLRTRARPGDGGYVVTGQKVWSSFADLADWCLLLVRTDPDVPKHRGLSLLLVDMRSPGIEVRPLRQATGTRKFAEIFFDDVVVPAGHLVSAPGTGWSLALSTLAAERGPMVVELADRLERSLAALVERAEANARAGRRPSSRDGTVRAALATLHGRVAALRWMCRRMLLSMADDATSSESSVVKLLYSEVLRDMTSLGVDLAGLDGQVVTRQPLTLFGGESEDWIVEYVNSWSWTIAGGTSEIQRTMIGERLLGLPREPA